jgi:hypothetical protein
MLLVVVLLPLSSPMCNGEFDHSGGGGGCGGPAAAAVAAVEAVEDNLSVKAPGNESVDGRMMACDDKSGRQTTTQQPTNERWRGGSATARGRRQLGGGAAAAAAAQQLRRWRQRESGCRRQLGGGAAVAAARQRDSKTARRSLAAVWRRQQRQRDVDGSLAAALRWQRTAQRW